MAHIPEDKLLEIREAASIEEVVGQYVKLERRGKTLTGLCPFHADSKPSFTVSPDRGIFHCFGCQAGGNVISFVMQYHKLSFPEAAAELARRYGITLTVKDMGPEESRRAKQRQTSYDLNREALAFYRGTLEGKGGKPGREYLKKRGLTPEIIQSFQLGYAPPEWDGLRRHLQNRGFSLEAAAEVGLLLPRTSGGYYDRFRDRVIFPIFDRQDRPVAFGGRIVGEGEPKYLNSPESPLYTKGRLLYGLPQAREALRHQDLAIVVEGYLDLLALRVHGIVPVVASLGTALTKEQVRLLKSQVSRVVLVFDGDPAGAKAMRRAFPLFGQEGLPVRVIALPAGQDPDTYVHSEGPELFASPWERALPWLAFLLDGLVEAHGLTIEGRVRIAEELRPYFQTLQDPVEQGLWLKFAAERLGVPETDLRLSLNQISTGPRYSRERERALDQPREGAHALDSAQPVGGARRGTCCLGRGPGGPGPQGTVAPHRQLRQGPPTIPGRELPPGPTGGRSPETGTLCPGPGPRGILRGLSGPRSRGLAAGVQATAASTDPEDFDGEAGAKP